MLYLFTMKYIITESQFKLLTEDKNFKNWIKRRMDSEKILPRIEAYIRGINKNHYEDSEEYADDIIRYSVLDFLAESPELYEIDFFDEMQDFLYDYVKVKYGEMIQNYFNDNE